MSVMEYDRSCMMEDFDKVQQVMSTLASRANGLLEHQEKQIVNLRNENLELRKRVELLNKQMDFILADGALPTQHNRMLQVGNQKITVDWTNCDQRSEGMWFSEDLPDTVSNQTSIRIQRRSRGKVKGKPAFSLGSSGSSAESVNPNTAGHPTTNNHTSSCGGEGDTDAVASIVTSEPAAACTGSSDSARAPTEYTRPNRRRTFQPTKLHSSRVGTGSAAPRSSISNVKSSSSLSGSQSLGGDTDPAVAAAASASPHTTVSAGTTASNGDNDDNAAPSGLQAQPFDLLGGRHGVTSGAHTTASQLRQQPAVLTEQQQDLPLMHQQQLQQSQQQYAATNATAITAAVPYPVPVASTAPGSYSAPTRLQLQQQNASGAFPQPVTWSTFPDESSFTLQQKKLHPAWYQQQLQLSQQPPPLPVVLPVRQPLAQEQPQPNQALNANQARPNNTAAVAPVQVASTVSSQRQPAKLLPAASLPLAVKPLDYSVLMQAVAGGGSSVGSSSGGISGVRSISGGSSASSGISSSSRSTGSVNRPGPAADQRRSTMSVPGGIQPASTAASWKYVEVPILSEQAARAPLPAAKRPKPNPPVAPAAAAVGVRAENVHAVTRHVPIAVVPAPAPPGAAGAMRPTSAGAGMRTVMGTVDQLIAVSSTARALAESAVADQEATSVLTEKSSGGAAVQKATTNQQQQQQKQPQVNAHGSTGAAEATATTPATTLVPKAADLAPENRARAGLATTITSAAATSTARAPGVGNASRSAAANTATDFSIFPAPAMAAQAWHQAATDQRMRADAVRTMLQKSRQYEERKFDSAWLNDRRSYCVTLEQVLYTHAGTRLQYAHAIAEAIKEGLS